MALRKCRMASFARDWKTALQLPPFALFLATSVVKWCSMAFRNCRMASFTWAWKTLAASIFAAPAFCHIPGHACRLSLSSFHTLPFPGNVCCQMVFAWRFESAGWHLSPRDWKNALQLPPFALFLATSVAKWCFYGISKLPDGIFHLGLKNPCSLHLCRTCFCHIPGHACRLSLSSFHTLPFPGNVCCQMVFAWRFESAGWHLSPRDWKTALQLPPFALFLATSVVKWCSMAMPFRNCRMASFTWAWKTLAASTFCRACFCHIPGHACRLSLCSSHPLPHPGHVCC